MRISIASPIPDMGSMPGPSRPGWGPTGSYDFQFEVTGAVTIKANAAGTGNFRVKWPNGTTQVLSGDNASIAAPDGTPGIVSINNEKLDDTYCDEFAVVGGQTNVSKVISWGQNPWNRLSSAFLDCVNLTDISTTPLITDGIGVCDSIFRRCTSLLEIDAKNWQVSSGWKAAYFAEGCTNLTKVDMTGLSMKIGRSDNWMQNVGTNVADGCEFLMSGISFISGSGSSTYNPYWFRNSKMKNTSTFASWSWDNGFTDWYGINMFDNIDFLGTDSTLNISGWSTFPGTTLSGYIKSINYTNGAVNNNLTIDLTGLNVSNVNSFSAFSQSSDVYKIKGISGWGAAAGNVNMQRMFESCKLLKIPTSDNFSDTFIQSLTPINLYAAFQQVGSNLPESDLEAAINLNGFDVSNCTSFVNTWYYYHSDNSLDFSNVTFGSTAHNFTRTWSNVYAGESNSTLNFPNQLVASVFSSAFQTAVYDNITFGNNVDFSQVTSVDNMLASQKSGVNITFPTAASGLSFASLSTTGNWFNATTGPTTGPLTTCQVDNLIRSFYNTALNSGLSVNFGTSQITESPSVVSTMIDELENTGGWNITPNTLDGTMPFVYTGSFLTGTNITPTINTSGGTFSSSDVTVNEDTGTFNTSTAGNVTIKYTLANGCYNEQVLSVVAPFTPFKFRVTGPISIKAQPAVAGQSFTIDWGDGSTPISTTGGTSIPSNFTTAGTYDVQINAQGDATYCDEFAIVSGQTNVTNVLDWGEKPWSNMTNAFSGCTSLSDISTTSFISSTQGDMITMFNGCTSLIEADIRNWDLTAGADWYGGSPFRGLVNLQKLDMTGLNVKLINRSDYAFSGIGTAVTDGCEFLMSNIDWSTSTSTYTINWFYSARFKNTSDLSGWEFPSSGWTGNGMFNSADITGTNSTLNLSGWSTYSGSQLPQFSSFNDPAGDTGLKIDMSNMGMSNVTTLASTFYYSDISEVIGLSTWGATAGNVNMNGMFNGCYHMKFSDSDNFTSTFINSLTPTDVSLAFYAVGVALTSGYGVAPNITNIDLSNCTNFHQFLSSLRCTSVPALNTATFPSTAIALTNLFTSSRFISSNETHLDFSNVAIKISSASNMFSSTWIDKVTFGDNVDFSALTNVTNMHYYMNNLNPEGTTTELTYPTNADFSSLTTTGNWFAGVQGPTTGALTTCQVDNLIRRFYNTALNSGLSVNFGTSQITESPSVVSTMIDELENTGGWNITPNTLDGTIPFEYTGDLEPDTNITPTNNTGGAFTGTFSSSNSNIAVNSTTGVINTPNVGNTTIRYTLADGCYNEQAISLVSNQISNVYSMNFDSASSDYIDAGTAIGDLIGDNYNGSLTASLWFKRSSNTLGGLINFTTSGWGEFTVLAYSNEIRFGINATAYYLNYNASNGYTYDTNWHHLVLVMTPNGSVTDIKMYFDGQLLTITPSGSAPVPTSLDFAGKKLFIGTWDATNYPFNGKIDEVAIWDTALTSTQIQSIYDATSTNSTKDLTTVAGSNLKYWNRMGD